jgi:hypothetical protein
VTFVRRTGLIVVSLILGLSGIVFIFQGVGILPGSFMTGEIVWAAIGAVLLFVAALLLWSAYKPTAAKS